MRGRIIKSMMLMTLITIFLLSMMLMGFFMLAVSGTGTMIATMSGTEIVKFISSPKMRSMAGYYSMSDLVNNKAALDTVIKSIERQNTIKLEELLDEDMMVERTRFNNEEEIIDLELIEELEEHGIEHPKNWTETFQMLGIRLFIGDEMVYENNGFIDNPESFVYRFLDTESHIPLYDEKTDEVVGVLEVQVHKNILHSIMWIVWIVFDVICLIAFIVAIFVSKLISIPVTRPLKKLIERLEQVAEEDIEWAVHKKIEFKKPLLEITRLTDATNTILDKMKVYSEKLEVQNEELEAQKDELEAQRDELEAQNDELESIGIELHTANDGLGLRNQQMRYILENVSQGFLIVGTDLNIEEEYSQECENIFKQSIGGKKLSDLLYLGNASEAAFLDSVITKLLGGEDEGIYLPLLPEELQMHDKTIQLTYSIVEDRIKQNYGIMVVLVDKTDHINLQKRMDYERTKLQMVVKTVSHRDDFVDLINEYKDYAVHGLKELHDSTIPCSQKCTELFRIIHNFKGNFSQYDLTNTVEKLHLFEDYLSDVMDQDSMDDASGYCVTFETLNMLEWIDEDMSVITYYLGEDYFDSKYVYRVEREQLDAIDEKMRDILPPQEYQQISPLIKGLKHLEMNKLIAVYPDYVNKLAERLGKEVNDVAIEGDVIRVDFDYISKFNKSLVHVFRNAIDHGIETMEERVEQGKPEIGTIACRIMDHEEHIVVEIEDDGRGINVLKIKERLMNEEMDADEVDRLSNDQLYQYLFTDGFSLKEDVGLISGRGVGMASTYATVDNMGGTTEVESVLGEGTTFRFKLPKQKEDVLPSIEPKEMFKVFKNKTCEHFKQIVGIELEMANEPEMEMKIELNKYTALVNYHGLRNGLVLLSMDEGLAKNLVDSFVLGDYAEDEFYELLEDTIAEISNIIIGNSFEDLGGIGEFINIGTPTMMCYHGASVKYTDAEILTNRIKTDSYELVLSMVSLDKDLEGAI